MGLVPATSPCNKSQGLVASCELATSLCDWSQGPVALCELLQNLVAGTSVPAISPTNSNQLAKMASSHDATSLCDLLHGLVAGTSPIVCADLKILCFLFLIFWHFWRENDVTNLARNFRFANMGHLMLLCLKDLFTRISKPKKVFRHLIT